MARPDGGSSLEARRRYLKRRHRRLLGDRRTLWLCAAIGVLMLGMSVMAFIGVDR